ncbi:hypothetical protein GOODEAATRI_001107, partial [Goodea atripinnis]
GFVIAFDLIILVNAVFIGLDEENPLISNSEWFFLAIYVLEILLKLYVFEPRAFFSKHSFWNWAKRCYCSPLSQVVYYIFAMVGMELFKNKVKFYEDLSNPESTYCGNPLLKGSTFAQLGYCKNNFNNVVSSFILLLELTVVNQWHDILLHKHPPMLTAGCCSPFQQESLIIFNFVSI